MKQLRAALGSSIHDAQTAYMFENLHVSLFGNGWIPPVAHESVRKGRQKPLGACFVASHS